MEEQSPGVVKWPRGTIARRLSWVQESSLRCECFEVRSKRSWAFLEEKSRDEVRPDIFGATALRRNRFTEFYSTVSMWVIDSKPNPNETNEKWSEYSAKVQKLWQWHTPAWQISLISARRDFGGIVNETQQHGHVAPISTHCRSCRAEPARYATDSDVS